MRVRPTDLTPNTGPPSLRARLLMNTGREILNLRMVQKTGVAQCRSPDVAPLERTGR
jgi:hypothetical protein